MAAFVSSLFSEFQEIPAAKAPDIKERKRRNPFLWRGQFPPELVASLLDSYAEPGSAVLDPFAGSGTVLLESARKGLACTGSDTNPAALEMARTYLFCGMAGEERKSCICAARDLLREAGAGSMPSRTLGDSDYARISMALRRCEGKPFVHNLLSNAILRTSLSSGASFGDIDAALETHSRIVLGLPHSDAECRVVRADARHLPVEDSSVDLIVTSPPYLNVFDYSRNYGRSAELLRWKPAEVAAHEIGSVDRVNPFLSVIRYALDLRLALCEMRRVLNGGGRAILVVGRESRIRGITFADSALAYALAAGGCGFALALRQERRFTTPDGNDVVEDILHLVPRDSAGERDGTARDSAKLMLKDALAKSKGRDREGIRKALKEVRTLKPTPFLDA
jgi:SAM-dependent methyltransferase